MSELTDRNKSLETLLGRFAVENPTVTTLVSTDAAEIGEYLAKNAPAGTAQKWLADLLAIVAPAKTRIGLGMLMLAAAGIVFVAILMIGIFWTPNFLTNLADPGNARGLITFLFAIATIAVIIISVIAVFWVKFDEVDKRGALAKEVLTILIGIMGTILGFYFGADIAQTTAAPTTPAPTTTEQPSP